MMLIFRRWGLLVEILLKESIHTWVAGPITFPDYQL
jgi:hypothetical protein